MSDHVAQSYHGADEKSGHSVHSCQSVWMAHWTQTSFTVAPCVQDRFSLCDETNHHRDSPSAKGFTEVTEARTLRIMNEGSSKNLINERLDCPPFPMFRISQNTGSMFDPKNDPDVSFHVQASRPEIESNVGATQILPYRLDKGKAPLLCMKNADINLSKEKQIFSDSNKQKRNMFGELLSLSQPLGQNQHVLKVQPLGCSGESEGANNTEDVGATEVRLQNESSAETDTMDMDAYKGQCYLSGVNSSLSKKDIMTGQKRPFQPIITSTGEEVGHRWPIATLPDMNEEIPTLPVAGSSLDNEEPTISRTQSLDAQHLVSNSEHPTQSKSTHCPDDYTGLEPGSRWLKRLKLSASDSFVQGTKRSDVGEVPSHEKANKLFGKNLEGSKSNSSETMSQKKHGKEERAKDQTAIVLLNGESSSAESVKRDQDLLLSNPWIRRWCRDGTHQTNKAEALVVCEPQSTKMEFDDLQNKPFPSIAAMALMGKAMSGFQPCKFQRRGSFVVWNT